MSINRVVLVGRLTRDPELKFTASGVAVANFNLAVNRNFKNANGEQEADFISVVVWKKPAENVANYLKKGSLVGVDGRIQTRNYEGQDGKRVYVTEVVAESVQFLDSKGSNNSDNGQSNGNGAENGNNRSQNFTRVDDDPFSNNGKTIDISDQDLPF